MMDYGHKPASIKRLQKTLTAQVVGKTIPYERLVQDSTLAVELAENTDVAKYLEAVTRTFSALDAKVKEVEAEPFGRNTFPDLKRTFNNNYVQLLEVKSWKQSKNFDLAKVSRLQDSILTLNPKYFQTWYVQWSYLAQEEGFYIFDVTIERLWRIASWHKTFDIKTHNKALGGHIALRPGMDNFETPLHLLFAFVATTVAMPEEQYKMFAQGVRLLQTQNLYSEEDLCLLKAKLRDPHPGVRAMRDAKHLFALDFS